MLVRALGGICENTDTLKLPDDEAVKSSANYNELKTLAAFVAQW